MQFAMNLLYGVLAGLGLYFIGIPNAVLWGCFVAVLRYVPFVGIWIAALFPLTLSLAISTSWGTPLLTLGLFAALEILCANLLEPLIYGSSTGVSSVALILAAVFWTWIWGTAGLVLSTPLTVCLVVMGTHVRRLEILSVLLSDDEALTPAEDLYYRMLASGERDETELIDTYLKTHSIGDLYDSVLVPVARYAASDLGRGVLAPEHHQVVEEGLQVAIQELSERPAEKFIQPTTSDELGEAAPSFPACRVLCLPAHSSEDDLVGQMMAHLLKLQGAEAICVPSSMVAGEMLVTMEKEDHCHLYFHPASFHDEPSQVPLPKGTQTLPQPENRRWPVEC